MSSERNKETNAYLSYTVVREIQRTKSAIMQQMNVQI